MTEEGLRKSQNPFGSDLTAGLRAGATIRFLEQSGPRYMTALQTVTLNRVLDDQVEALTGERTKDMMSAGNMSFASWCECRGAKKGDVLQLKMRRDRIGGRPAFT